MGEARAKKRAHAVIIADNPWCIYCGGETRADTIEHMPPIQMFYERQRPKGLEFSACRKCNIGTRYSDLVASLMGRMYPDAVTESAKQEVRKLLKSIGNNVPGLLQEMEIGRGGLKIARQKIPNMPPNGGVLRANGPILSRHMKIFGAKIGFALHFEVHRKTVPLSGGVQTMYFTNVNVLRGELPTSIIELLPTPKTLRQGTKNVNAQFRYSWRITEEGRHTLFYAEFNQAFAVMALTAQDRNEFLMRNAERFPVVIPGQFKAEI